MNTHSVIPQSTWATLAANRQPTAPADGNDESLKEKFTEFVGESLFGQMMSALRSGQEQPAYLGGGHAEKIFQGQLDQIMVQEITEASAERVAEPMFELFQLSRAR